MKDSRETLGKAYANRKKLKDRPKGDLYHTPRSLLWELQKVEAFQYHIADPSCGSKVIEQEFKEHGVLSTDIDMGIDFFDRKAVGSIYIGEGSDSIQNPPFSKWDDFVFRCKELGYRKIAILGRTNYFGCDGRSKSGIWDRLARVHIFNRYVDYQTPLRDDGLFHVGAMQTAWFIWELGHTGPWTGHIMDVQKYAKLGSIIKEKKCPDCLKKTQYNVYEKWICHRCKGAK